MGFFRSKKFWLPLLMVLAAEGFFAIGGWEPLVEPASYAGYATRVKTRFVSADRQVPHYATIGNSLPLLGLEHRDLDANARSHGARHYAMAIPGSHLTMLSAQTQWISKQSSAVRGLVIGVGIRAFHSPTLGFYELPAVMPFRTLGQVPTLMKQFDLDVSEPRSLGALSALVNYREDVAAFLRDPKKRLKSLAWARRQSVDDVLLFEPLPDSNICPIELGTPARCLASIGALGNVKTGPGTLRVAEVKRLCQRAAGKRQPPVSDLAQETMQQAWSQLLIPLSRTQRIVVVLMPTHPLMRQYRLSENLHETALAILGELENEGIIDVLDLTALFDHAEHLPCHYFQDLQHAAAAGRREITRAVVAHLNQIDFYR